MRAGRIEAVLGQSVNLQPAVFDLKRSGLHFQIVGPPVSGKTTALYNFVFSLAYRYTPEEVMLLLVDPQRRFADYGGQQFGRPPTSWRRSTKYGSCRRSCACWQTRPNVWPRTTTREVFILVDNYDDIGEDIDRLDNLARISASGAPPRT